MNVKIFVGYLYFNILDSVCWVCVSQAYVLLHNNHFATQLWPNSDQQMNVRHLLFIKGLAVHLPKVYSAMYTAS